MTKTAEALSHWQRYVNGYMACLENDTRDATADMGEGWDDFVRMVGQENALLVFWDWQNTLPRNQRSDCDPDGN